MQVPVCAQFLTSITFARLAYGWSTVCSRTVARAAQVVWQSFNARVFHQAHVTDMDFEFSMSCLQYRRHSASRNFALVWSLSNSCAQCCSHVGRFRCCCACWAKFFPPLLRAAKALFSVSAHGAPWHPPASRQSTTDLFDTPTNLMIGAPAFPAWCRWKSMLNLPMSWYPRMHSLPLLLLM